MQRDQYTKEGRVSHNGIIAWWHPSKCKCRGHLLAASVSIYLHYLHPVAFPHAFLGMPCTRCKVLYVGKYSNPSFGPLGEHLTWHACAVPRAIRGVANLALNTKPGEVQQDANL